VLFASCALAPPSGRSPPARLWLLFSPSIPVSALIQSS
jgi:hypothetical protein